MRHWRSCSVCNVTATSSANSRSLMIQTSSILVFPLSLGRLNSLLSDLVCSYTPSVEAFLWRRSCPLLSILHRSCNRTLGRCTLLQLLQAHEHNTTDKILLIIPRIEMPQQLLQSLLSPLFLIVQGDNIGRSHVLWQGSLSPTLAEDVKKVQKKGILQHLIRSGRMPCHKLSCR